MRSLLLVFFTVCMLKLLAQESILVNPNQAAAQFFIDGMLFTSATHTKAGFANPYIYGAAYQIENIYPAVCIISGFDSSDQLHIKGGGKQFTRLTPGPLSDNTAIILDSTNTLYNREWKVLGSDILSLQADFADNQIIDRPPSSSLLSWPGRNNPHFLQLFNFELPDQDLAPFFDQNDDEVYNPLDGDYPILDSRYPTAIPNEMTWNVYHDLNAANTEYPTFPFEYHIMVYGFDCLEKSPLNKTIFTKVDVLNKSSEIFHGIKMGFNTRFSLGCSIDDFKGTDTELNTIYCYNKDSLDGDMGTQCFTDPYTPTYQDTPGVVSCTYLNHRLRTSILFDEPFTQGNPTNINLTHLFLNGIEFNRLSPNDPWYLDTVNYSFTDYPTIVGGHSMIYSPHDLGWRDSYAGTDVNTFMPGDKFSLENAWYATYTAGLSSLEQPNTLAIDIPKIQAFAASGYILCTPRLEANCLTDCVWPGDANSDGYVLGDDMLAVQFAIDNNYTGPKRYKTSEIWRAFDVMPWMDSFNFGTINTTHTDCYGDGHANSQDAQVVIDNFGKSRWGYPKRDKQAALSGETGIRLEPRSTYIHESDHIAIKSLFASRDSIEFLNMDLTKLKGISFSVILDSTIYSIDQLEYKIPDEVTFDEQQQLTIFTHYNEANYHIDFTYYKFAGEFPKFIKNNILRAIKINPALTLPAHSDTMFLPYPIFDLRSIDSAGNYSSLEYFQDSVFLWRRATATHDFQLVNKIVIYPNPCDDVLQIHSDLNIRSLELFDLHGRSIALFSLNSSANQINTSIFPAGIYFAELTFDHGQSLIKKVVIQH